MLILLGLLIVGLLAWHAGRSNAENEQRRRAARQLQELNQGWIAFVAGYAKVATTKREKALVARMVADIEAQQGQKLPAFGSSKYEMFNAETPSARSNTVLDVSSAAPAQAPSWKNTPVDNASLLLYFGAFLFVASAGLFVAFGGATGGIKVLTVFLVMAVMYGSGIWLFHNRPKLRQAGQTFAGIGIVLAPLVGVAFYAYAFERSYGAVVWLLTSILCLGLYWHALKVFRTTLMGFVLVFTFLSVFESGVGIASVPVYYYGWGLALVGIILQLLVRRPHARTWEPELREPTRQSAQLFMPVAVFASLVMVPQLGAIQLGISLILGGIFYYLEASVSDGQNQQTNAVASQLALVTGAALVVYGYDNQISQLVWALLVLNGVQLAVLLVRGKVPARDVQYQLWQNYGSVLLAFAVAAVVVAVDHAALLVAASIGAVIIGGIIYGWQRRADAYAIAALAWMGLPYIYGQGVVSWPGHGQTLAGLAALIVLLGVYLAQSAKSRTADMKDWKALSAAAYGVGALSVLFASLFTVPLFCLAVTVVVMGTLAVLAERHKQAEWSEVAAAICVGPLLVSAHEPKAFLVTVLVVLVLLIGLSLRYRRELLRWASTIVWLVLPFALGQGGVGAPWPADGYVWGYMVAMVGLILSRAIARGTLFLSTKVPLSSLMRSASVSYVAGYCTAAGIALTISLFSDQSRLQTSLVLAVLCVAASWLGKYVEKQAAIFALLPVLIQALLLSIVRPAMSGVGLHVYLMISIVFAAVAYDIASHLRQQRPQYPQYQRVMQAALATAFIAPAAILFAHNSWPMPVGLAVAGLLVWHYVRLMQQEYKELAGGIVALAIMWFLWWAGVRQVQAYSHVLVALFALYAYWRHRRGETNQADQYLIVMLATATLPLALQAIGGTGNTSLYGWWLLIEQVAIMLVGMAIQRRFVTMWGLYVAVGAVLYQLRHLGYAALGLLALFLIGLAIYRLQKNNSK